MYGNNSAATGWTWSGDTFYIKVSWGGSMNAWDNYGWIGNSDYPSQVGNRDQVKVVQGIHPDKKALECCFVREDGANGSQGRNDAVASDTGKHSNTFFIMGMGNSGQFAPENLTWSSQGISGAVTWRSTTKPPWKRSGDTADSLWRFLYYTDGDDSSVPLYYNTPYGTVAINGTGPSLFSYGDRDYPGDCGINENYCGVAIDSHDLTLWNQNIGATRPNYEQCFFTFIKKTN